MFGDGQNTTQEQIQRGCWRTQVPLSRWITIKKEGVGGGRRGREGRAGGLEEKGDKPSLYTFFGSALEIIPIEHHRLDVIKGGRANTIILLFKMIYMVTKY